MGFNEFIGKLFGNKATRDMKEIKPWVDKVKAIYRNRWIQCYPGWIRRRICKARKQTS